MTPFYFGSSERQLFGIYDAPPCLSHRGVILCYPWGEEYTNAHRCFGSLARRLARGGNHVLRFDYYGSGDSAGKGTETTLESWFENLEWALGELNDMAELRSIALIGLRLGGVITAKAALKYDIVKKLVLWDPVFDGQDYLKELFENPQHMTRSLAYKEIESREGGEVIDIKGVPLTPVFRNDIMSVTKAHYNQPLPPTMVITVLERPEIYSELRTALVTAGVEFIFKHCVGPRFWVNDDVFGSKGIPSDALRCIAEWLK